MAEAFAIHATSSPREIRTMRSLLAKTRADEMEGLLLSQSWDDFNRRKGRIEALGNAIDILEQFEQQEQSR